MQRLSKIPKQVIEDTYDHFVEITPYRSGNAQRSTRLHGNTIEGNYPYAQRLDTGWSSQAPEGMTGPARDYFEQRLDQLVNKEKE